jgi:hypothetical protein
MWASKRSIDRLRSIYQKVKDREDLGDIAKDSILYSLTTVMDDLRLTLKGRIGS